MRELGPPAVQTDLECLAMGVIGGWLRRSGGYSDIARTSGRDQGREKPDLHFGHTMQNTSK